MMTSPGKSGSHLLSQVRHDLSERWQRGDRVPVEDYFARYPDLACDREAMLELIFAEALLRDERGESLTLADYLERFPAQSDQLRARWGLLWMLAPGAGAGLHDTDSEHRTLISGTPVVPILTLPGYELLREVGRGAMGIVFEARQTELDRRVAVKLIRSGPLAGIEELARFRVEAQAVARLRHSGVVQIYAFGEHEGCLFLVMEYLPGGSLSQRLKVGRMPLREAVTLTRDLARAMQAAHDVQVIHRDLKPSNILLDKDGTPKVSDFGLARLLDAETELTRSQAILGTPANMSPEQAAGKVHETGPAADIWALGGILYECLAGSAPFQADTRSQTIERVLRAEPPSLCKACPEVPAELEAVCLHCLEKEPSRRYASAGALADDLDRWLNGQPLSVRPLTRLQKAGRWLARHRGAVASILAVALLAAAAYIVNDARDPDRPLRAIDRQLAKAERVALLGEDGSPRWSRWALAEATKTRHSDGSFMLESGAHSFLEVARAPRKKSYRFSARIRHESGQETNAMVGLAVGRAEFALPQNRKGQVFLEAIFNDQVPAPKQPGPNPPLNPVLLQGLMATRPEMRESGIVRFRTLAVPTFRPAGPNAPQWRTLAIEVRPGKVRVLWDGKQVGEVTDATIERKAGGLWNTTLPKRPDLAGIDCPNCFKPEGGVGLIVRAGRASFADIFLEPLEE